MVAILAAAVAGFSSAAVAVINGHLQREIEKNKSIESLRIEESRSEAVRILEMIKTGEPDKAASNLQFLIDTGLITEKARVQHIQSYLAQRKPGTGPFCRAKVATRSSPQVLLLNPLWHRCKRPWMILSDISTGSD